MARAARANILEDPLHIAVKKALDVLLPEDAVVVTWELRNARSRIEGARRKQRGAVAGWPDMGVWWRERVKLIELKRSKGGTLNDAQKVMFPRLAAAGFPVAVCRSHDDVLDAIEAAGIPLRGLRAGRAAA